MDKNANRSWKLRKAVAYWQGSARHCSFKSFTQAEQCVSCATYIKLGNAGCFAQSTSSATKVAVGDTQSNRAVAK